MLEVTTGAQFPMSAVRKRQSMCMTVSLYSYVSSKTILVIPSLLHTSATELVIRSMDVQKQSNGSDCGVFAAFCLYTGLDPCIVEFDIDAMRPHLAECLENCCFSPFPSARRVSKQIRRTKKIDIHCSCRLPERNGDSMAQCDIHVLSMVS